MPAFYFEVSNPVTGFSHKSWLIADDLAEAKADVKGYAPIFGASCRVVSVTKSTVPPIGPRSLLKPWGTPAKETALTRWKKLKAKHAAQDERATKRGFERKSPKDYVAARLNQKTQSKRR